MKKNILTFVAFLFCFLETDAQKLNVDKFEVMSNDITARTHPRQDINGNDCALIKVQLAFPKALFDGTVIGNVAYEASLYMVYMSQGSKRLTIRLEGYLPLDVSFEDFGIKSLESKTVYVMTISEVSGSQRLETPSSPIQTHFFIGAGFNALSVMGPSLSMGLEVGKFIISADYMFGVEKVEGLGVYYKQSGQTASYEAYDYTASKAIFRIGRNFSPDTSVQLIPQAGVSVKMIKGKDLVNNGKSETQFEKVNSLSAFVALSLRIKLDKTFCLHITPQYDFSIGKNDAYKIIKDADKKIKAWGEGVGLNVGVLLRF